MRATVTGVRLAGIASAVPAQERERGSDRRIDGNVGRRVP